MPRIPAIRTDVRHTLAALSTLASLTLLAAPTAAQTALPAPDTTPLAPPTMPAPAPAVTPAAPPAPAPAAAPTPAPAPAPAPATAPAPAAAPAPEAPAVTQPFVGTITADKVYVRSGPGAAYYDVGQLAKGDTVQVVAERAGWYQIFPPNGSYCMIAKEFVETDAAAGGGQTGTVKADYVNLRAGPANKNHEPSAVLCVVRKGTKLTILGSTDKFYEIAPTDHAYVFISPQFVKPAPGTDYKIPDLQFPPGVTPVSRETVTAVAPLPPAAPPEGPATPLIAPPAPTPPEVGPAPTPPAPPVAHTRPAVPVPQPAVVFSAEARTRFNELNDRYQAELRKPVGTRDLDPLIKDYKALSATDNVAPSIKQGSDARIAALEKLATIQRLQKESAASADMLAEQRKALQQQYAAQEKAIEDYENSGPYVAKGRLQDSTVVKGKYALVNPLTGRTEAYVDPASQIDIGSLLGKYIGVRGTTRTAPGTDVQVIEVKNATLLPAPEVPKPVEK